MPTDLSDQFSPPQTPELEGGSLSGSPYSDHLHGGPLAESIFGWTGDDWILGSGGDDIIDGGEGSDTAWYSGAGKPPFSYAVDYIATGVTANLKGGFAHGGGGNDTLISIENVVGSDFDDHLIGNRAANDLNGGKGSDTLVGGRGKDVLTGGEEADIFVFRGFRDSKVGAARDIITDFGHGSDVIAVSKIDAIAGCSDNSFIFVETEAFSHIPGELRYTTTDTRTVISGDVDGDGRADFQIQLRGMIDLTVDDFIL